MAMFRRVLFPTDFSEPANRLLECLGAFRPLGVEDVVLLHVTDVRQAVNLLGFDMTFYERHDDLARRELERSRERVEAVGFAFMRSTGTGACRTVYSETLPSRISRASVFPYDPMRI